MIGIFDSGAGGMSVFKEIYKLLPEEEYIYYADNGHCPYGSKSKEYIFERCKYITDLLIKKGADIIVIACNTATAAAIKKLRKLYSTGKNPYIKEKILRLSNGKRDRISFIGMEPAIKPASKKTKNGIVGVLATAGTLRSEKYKNTKEKFAKDIKVIDRVGVGFVKLVENETITGLEAEKVVRKSLKDIIKQKADTIVLGCTHFPFLKDIIKELMPPNTLIIDPAPAVAKRTLYIMNKERLIKENASTNYGKIKIEILASRSTKASQNILNIVLKSL